MSPSIEERLIEHYDRVTADVPAEGPGLDTVTVRRVDRHRRRSWPAVVLGGVAAAAIVVMGLVVVNRNSPDTTVPGGPSVPSIPSPPATATSTTEAATTASTTVTSETPASASCANADLLAAVRAVDADNPDWDPTAVNVNACRNGYAEVVVILDQSRCPTPGVECRDNQRAWLHDIGGSWRLVDIGTGVGCSPEEITPTLEAACAALAATTSIGPSAVYCAQVQALEGERPAAYVGSAEQLADFTALRAAAPPQLAEQLDVFIAYLESGAIHDGDPDSNLIENFPADVQAAITEISSFNEANC